MLNRENINKDLWEIIKVHYEKECYTDSLKDACLYIIQLIQEKSDIDDLDGEKLINNVFSESNPKLLINKNQTQTEKDEQKGFGFLLRGIVCAIRNPISHKNNFKFSKEEADSILLFISNYILPRLDDSKDFGYVNDWFDFVFITNNNDSKNYSNIILENIPKKEKFNLMIEIIESLQRIDSGKYRYFINKLYELLTSKEKEEIIILLNKELIKVGDDQYLRMFFDHFNSSTWSNIDVLIKTRIEEMIIESIKEGKSYQNPRTLKVDCTGSLGTWACDWIEFFSNKQEIVELLFKKLNNVEEANYVINYFSTIIGDRKYLKKYSKEILDGLNKGKNGYKSLLDTFMYFYDDSDKLLCTFKEAYDNFTSTKKEDVLSDCDLPF